MKQKQAPIIVSVSELNINKDKRFISGLNLRLFFKTSPDDVSLKFYLRSTLRYYGNLDTEATCTKRKYVCQRTVGSKFENVAHMSL